MKKPWDLRERTMWFAINVIRFVATYREPRRLQKLPVNCAVRVAVPAPTTARRNVPVLIKTSCPKWMVRLKRPDESMFWLDVLLLSEITRDVQARELRAEANELVSIFVASRTTAISRVKLHNQKRKEMKRKRDST
jgi:hypothetical protein